MSVSPECCCRNVRHGGRGRGQCPAAGHHEQGKESLPPKGVTQRMRPVRGVHEQTNTLCPSRTLFSTHVLALCCSPLPSSVTCSSTPRFVLLFACRVASQKSHYIKIALFKMGAHGKRTLAGFNTMLAFDSAQSFKILHIISEHRHAARRCSIVSMNPAACLVSLTYLVAEIGTLTHKGYSQAIADHAQGKQPGRLLLQDTNTVHRGKTTAKYRKRLQSTRATKRRTRHEHGTRYGAM